MDPTIFNNNYFQLFYYYYFQLFFIMDNYFRPSLGTSLLTLGSDGVPLPFVVRFMKLAFSYEQWDVLDVLLQPFITMLKTGPDLIEIPAYIVALQLLAAMEPFCNTGRKQKRGVSYCESGLQENTQGNRSNAPTVNELLVIANVLGSSSQLPTVSGDSRELKH